MLSILQKEKRELRLGALIMASMMTKSRKLTMVAMLVMMVTLQRIVPNWLKLLVGFWRRDGLQCRSQMRYCDLTAMPGILRRTECHKHEQSPV